jgi:HAD superfamily hydrolase (TIGR01509 family)
MSRIPRPAAVIFDLDGTLVDTVDARIEGWAAAFAAAGIPAARDQLRPLIGMDGVRLATEVATAAGRPIDRAAAEDLDRRAGTAFDEHNRAPRPLPGVHDMLGRLEKGGITWAIATSSRAGQVRASVAALALEHEPRIVDGSSVEHAKPAPDLLLHAARQLGVDPRSAWYVGDSTWDMAAAVGAGMRPIGVTAGAAVDGQALRDAGAAEVLGSLAELHLPD